MVLASSPLRANASEVMASSTLSQDQIVPMDQLLPATVAETGLDFTTLVTLDALGVGIGVGAQAPGDLAAVGIEHDHRVAALESGPRSW